MSETKIKDLELEIVCLRQQLHALFDAFNNHYHDSKTTSMLIQPSVNQDRRKG